MSLYMVLGTSLVFLGAVQMMPWFRRRAVQRGFSGWIGIPFIFVVIGFVTFIASALEWL